MDAILTVMVPCFLNWEFDKTETLWKGELEVQGIVNPVSFRFGEHIKIEPRPIYQWLAKFIPEGEVNWHSFVLRGDYINMLETEANGWIEPDEAKPTGLDIVIKHICDSTPNCVWVFEPCDEPIDLIYANKGATWIFERIKSAMDRKKALQAFAVFEETQLCQQNLQKTKEMAEIKRKLIGILTMHSKGFYTEGEVIHAAVQLLGKSEIDIELWHSLPEWVRRDIIDQLADFHAETELYLFHHSQSGMVNIVKGQYLALKSWLLRMNLI
ncbi:hypothetical protein UNDKW_3938 [Undibacterium sp. KW1]|uniref:hypothetical protein n=1 Tax=Undibacterium sp. KW1 TaxID=2058624 RepID=UPI001331CBDF|nr:hypothetical protein [Undibacterium sp. KW1]BBB62211.1 hypothetical protein UNDKW_3938 [Undibacterium sp. KW1]